MLALDDAAMARLAIAAAAPSLDQPYHPAAPYSIKRMNDVVPIEYGLQTFHRSRRVPRSRLDIFPENAPGVLNGPYQNLLVGIIHSGNPRVTEVRNWPPTSTELHRLP
jgi:hypothetical protein